MELKLQCKNEWDLKEYKREGMQNTWKDEE